MNMNEFDTFLCDEIIPKIQETLNIKSGDYSDAKDKLFNFKLQARIDGVTPVEALRGDMRKHIASIVQALDELKEGNLRERKWFHEKVIDNINYLILLLALLEEQYDVKQNSAFLH